MNRSKYLMLLLLLMAGTYQARAGKKPLDGAKELVVERFDSSIKGAIGLPDAVRNACVQAVKESDLFTEVITAEEETAKASEKDSAKQGGLRLTGQLVDFEAGNAAKRLMVGFGSGRAHAGFEFALRDPATGEIVWHKKVKQTASFWFNGTTSSAEERAELPEGLAKKLVEELKKEQGK